MSSGSNGDTVTPGLALQTGLERILKGQRPGILNTFMPWAKVTGQILITIGESTAIRQGCGAGRITRQLAKIFKDGHAIDVSADMINLGKAYVRDNVTWHLTLGYDLPLPDHSVDAAFSCHVFQHFASAAVGMAYFAEISRVLKPDGSLMVHLPLMPCQARRAKNSLACYSCNINLCSWQNQRNPVCNGFACELAARHPCMA
jgi:SAM-dependent methyltransferase